MWTHIRTHAHTPCQRGKGEFHEWGSSDPGSKRKARGLACPHTVPTPPCPKADLGTPFLAPTKKRYQIWDLRTPPGSVLCSYGKFMKSTLRSCLPAFPRRSCLPASFLFPLLDTDTPPRFPHRKRKTACGTVHTWWVRTRAALGSPSCKYWQLQIKVLRVVDIDTTF